MEQIFNGLYGIVLTPFKENGEVNYGLLEAHVQRTVNAEHLSGLAVCGSTGEFTRLTFEENIELMKTVKNAIDGKMQFICGATAGDSYTASKYVESISKLGADGILLAPPYYFKLNDDEILEYYKDVINNNSAKIPIIGYNIPQCTNPVSVSVFNELLAFDCIKGYKNSWNDMQEITSEISLRNEKRPDVAMFTGLDACLYGTLSLGGNGIFSAITYLMPEVMGFIYKNFAESQMSFECQCDLIKLIDVINQFTFPYGYRVLSEALGMPLGKGREVVPIMQKNKACMAKKELLNIYERIINKYRIK